ncbi:indolepyruvate ferredoxin oxidoreductase [Parafrankia irregularis]|uniref:Indolepyruvate ferredoxin oxidoreductase n=1 Tax=Parafrankia irregularis TaxID=795642 RepID=A0A0S4QJP0_9ACTN|nr:MULTISPECIES: indolepyruvate ferredoxin oxidoreductase family protein [Parafrankia]MBE3203848.1 indolepyruvate ferredoxin oxidoreductase family protein [Parafrankia sp. CH37]CUU55282.1 indolepyruvate ferredoxin oxidoreductase [Parafrankia irregularis]
MTTVVGTETAAARPARAAAKLLSGVETLARLLVVREQVDARDGLTTATMVSGYPGSPLGTFDLTLDRLGAEQLGEHRIVHRPGLNEELAAAVVWGSQMGAVSGYTEVDGVVGAWYGKTPGLDRCGDVLKHANAMGSGPGGGVVMFCGDDPTAKSSTLPCESLFTFEDACVPVLYPGDQQEVLDLGVHAYRLSRYCGSWVGMKIVTAVADGVGSVDLDLDRHDPVDPPDSDVLVDGVAWRHRPQVTIGPHAVPGQEALVVDHRLRAAAAYARRNGLDRVVGAAPGAPLGIVCGGKTYFDVVQALTDLGVRPGDLAAAGVRVLKLGMMYPLVESTVTEFARSVDEIVVVEEKRPFVETHLRSVLHEAGVLTPINGKRAVGGGTLLSSVGELDPAVIAKALTRVRPELAVSAGASGSAATSAGAAQPRRVPVPLPLIDLPSRSPGFCSGCPHNRSTVFPDGALVGGGVGCHGIMYFESRNKGMTSMPPTPMGSEGVPWIGLSPFVGEPHLIQNLGDGTLSHSGTLAIRASVAAGADITFKILYNAAVAMTGGQDVTGLMDVPAMTRALEAEGVRRIVVCAEDPKRYGRRARWARGVQVRGRDALPQVQEELREVTGVTVIIYDQRCAAEARRLRKRGELPEPPRRVVINEAVCEGCGDCGTKSNCLSVLPVETELGIKRRIDDLSCNRDYTCLDGDCPSFVTVRPKRRSRLRPARAARSARRAPKADIPEQGSGAAAGSGVGSGAGPGSAGGRRRRGRDARPALPAGTLPVPDAPRVDGQYGIYLTGIGGTGIVTASRIIAAAAEKAGLVVGGVDQTGLSQKAGAVVSHLNLATSRAEIGSATVGSGGADLYLSGDILQAATASNLGRTRPGHTIAVVEAELTPTTAMLQGNAAAPDPDDLRRAVEGRLGTERTAFVDGRRIAERVFADQLLGNVVLLGAAFQLGGLPLTLDDLEAALRRQGRAAAANREAFEWGRWAAHDPAAVEACLAVGPADPSAGGSAAGGSPAGGSPAGGSAAAGRASASGPALHDPSPVALDRAAPLVDGSALPSALRELPDLRELLVRRTAQVIDYSGPGLARRFVGLVEKAAARDGAEHGWELTRAVAEAWFKLLTYKDEYEVARLHLKVDYDQVASELGIDGPYQVTYHLHPPVLRALGVSKKLPMGRPYAAAFHLLRAMKPLRGTPFDPFGLLADRRTERAVIEEFERLMTELLEPGPAVPYEALLRAARSPQAVKGYGEIKEAAVARWRDEVSRLRGELEAARGAVTATAGDGNGSSGQIAKS